jgi:hypothetical protein
VANTKVKGAERSPEMNKARKAAHNVALRQGPRARPQARKIAVAAFNAAVKCAK